MDSETDDELRQLRAALRGVLRLDNIAASPTVDPEWRESWPALAELGVSSFCVTENQGGFGLRVDAAVIAAVELGAALHAAPFAGITAAAHLLSSCGGADSASLLAEVVHGTRTCAFGRLAPDGRSAVVVDGAVATDALLLLEPRSGEALLFDTPSTWQAETAAYQFDSSRACAHVEVDSAKAHRLPTGNAAALATELHGLLLAADAVGCLQRALDSTVAYAAQRFAFGRPIGAYQAVQHRLADHTVRFRGMSLLVADAARLMVSRSPEAARQVATAQVSVSTSAVHILHDLVQLTGGIGFTWEYGLHHFERRAHQDARLAATPRSAVRALAQIEGWTVAS